MAKITDEDREKFAARIEPYKEVITEMLAKEKAALRLREKNTSGKGYQNLLLCEDMIYIATLYVAINAFFVDFFGVNNTSALNEGRKSLYRAVIYLEEVVTNTIDAPFSDYADKLAEISNTPISRRYFIIRKLGLALKMVIDSYGSNTKWKWAFAELTGRFAVVAKNIIDLKTASKVYYDPNERDYDTTVLFLRRVKSLLGQCADKYRDRYEFSTHRGDDMRMGINLLLALRRICILMSDAEESEEIKKKAMVWKAKMEADQKKSESV
ncbi:MAG: hypothetical protein Pg6C_14670 [Treponemataceae bacterium]|nr:MAG: hypothetical protein Pg6C_14670 [Treponemataceae bacterium]